MVAKVGRVERKRQMVRECEKTWQEVWQEAVGRCNFEMPVGVLVWRVLKNYWEYENRRISLDRRKFLIKRLVERVEEAYCGKEIDWAKFKSEVNLLLSSVIRER